MKRALLLVICGIALAGGVTLIVVGMSSLSRKCELNVALCKD